MEQDSNMKIFKNWFAVILSGSVFINSFFFVYAYSEENEIDKQMFYIKYQLVDGYNSILNPSEFKKNDLPLQLQNPRRTGYSFGGWYLDENYKKRIYRIKQAKDYKIYAKWNLNINAHQNVQDYPYEEDGTELLLKELPYDFLYQIDTPGNPKTRVEDLLRDKYASEYQCPQGLCLTPEYLIVSSYSLENDKLGALTLYDRRTGDYVVSLGMEASSHLGGIAFDGEQLWICHSKTKELECISYGFIKKIATLSQQNFIDISNCFTKYKVKNVPSCITCKDGKIYVATHKVYSPGMLYCYELSDNSLQLQEKFLIPPKVQGLCVDEKGQIWLSQSYGRNQSSHLYVYQDFKHLKREFLLPAYAIEMPPGSESVQVEGDVCLVLFETASYKYYEGSDGFGTCKYPIDKILVIDANAIPYD